MKKLFLFTIMLMFITPTFAQKEAIIKDTTKVEVSYDTLTNMEKTAVLLEKDSIINSQNELIQKLPMKLS